MSGPASVSEQRGGNDQAQCILLIEDDEAVRRSLQLLLHWRGYDVRSYGSARPILDHPPGNDVDLLVVDYRLPDTDGIEVLRAMRNAGWQGRAILITAYSSPTLCEAAWSSGFHAVLEKPLRQHELIGALAA